MRDVIVGNEPNLNRFWLPQFDEPDGTTRPRRPTSRCWPRPTTLPRRSIAGRDVIGRRARRRAAIDRPGRVATRTRRRASSRISASPTARAAATEPRSRRLRLPPYPVNSSIPPDRPRTRTRRRSGSPTTTEARRPCSRTRSARACRSSTASSASRRAIPPAKATLYDGRESPAGRSTSRRRRDYYRRRDRAGGLPEGRRRMLLLPLPDESALTGFQSGRLLRRRDAEDGASSRSRSASRRPPGVSGAYDRRP